MENYRPRIILSAAITLDGKLATRTGDSKLSSKKDKIRVHKLRSKVDAILIGKNTVNDCAIPQNIVNPIIAINVDSLFLIAKNCFLL